MIIGPNSFRQRVEEHAAKREAALLDEIEQVAAEIELEQQHMKHIELELRARGNDPRRDERLANSRRHIERRQSHIDELKNRIEHVRAQMQTRIESGPQAIANYEAAARTTLRKLTALQSDFQELGRARDAVDTLLIENVGVGQRVVGHVLPSPGDFYGIPVSLESVLGRDGLVERLVRDARAIGLDV